MRIRKKEQSVGILGKILSLFSNSNTNAYSCDYINKTYGGGVKNYSTEEVKLDEKWINGKPIYRKFFRIDGEELKPNIWTIVGTIPDIDEIIFMSSVTENSGRDVIYNMYVDGLTSTPEIHPLVLRYVRDVKVLEVLPFTEGWTSPVLIVYIEYTKTTD